MGQPDRLARFDRNFREHIIRRRGKNGTGKITFSDRRAADHDNKVSLLQRACGSFCQDIRLIRQSFTADEVTTLLAHEGGDARRNALRNGTCTGMGLSRSGEFIARGEDDNTRLAIHAQFRPIGRGRRRQRPPIELHTRRNKHISGLEI